MNFNVCVFFKVFFSKETNSLILIFHSLFWNSRDHCFRLHFSFLVAHDPRSAHLHHVIVHRHLRSPTSRTRKNGKHLNRPRKIKPKLKRKAKRPKIKKSTNFLPLRAYYLLHVSSSKILYVTMDQLQLPTN